MIYHAHLENGPYYQIVTHLEMELEVNVLLAPDELQVVTVSQQATNTNANRPKPTSHQRKKPGHDRNPCHQLSRQKEQAEAIQIKSGNKKCGAISSLPNNKNNNNNNKNRHRVEKKPRIVDLAYHTCGKINNSLGGCHFGATQQTNRLPGTEDRKDRTRSNRETTEIILREVLKLQPKI